MIDAVLRELVSVGHHRFFRYVKKRIIVRIQQVVHLHCLARVKAETVMRMNRRAVPNRRGRLQYDNRRIFNFGVQEHLTETQRLAFYRWNDASR